MQRLEPVDGNVEYKQWIYAYDNLSPVWAQQWSKYKLQADYHAVSDFPLCYQVNCGIR